jgi:hypothetical protein
MRTRSLEEMMSNDEENVGLFHKVFGGISLRIKLILGFLAGIFSFLALFFISKNTNSKKIMELELKKVREEIEIEKAKVEIDNNNERLIDLENRAYKIKEEILRISSKEPIGEVSREELDEFFDTRGF